MNKSTCLAAAFALAFAFQPAPVHADSDAQDSMLEIAAYEKQIDLLTAKYEAFQIATAEDQNFRKNWLNRLRVAAAVKPLTAGTPNFVLSLGSEMLLDKIGPYLRRSDDDSSIAYMSVLTKIVNAGTTNESICRTFLEAADKKAVSDDENQRLESILGKALYDEMTVVFGQVMRTGRSGKERTLPKNESDAAILEMVTIMMDKYGKESAAGLAVFNDKSTPPMQKCTTMSQMMTSIADLKRPEQAGLIRTLFGMDDT
ncbi:MAG TPA: hypothetical protein VN248_01530 [Arenimonas sp.]|nr:hypothetical protein [Arenimonas sp.]